MRRILMSLLTISVVGAVGVAATQAFFSDTETSTGNTFQAGTLDLVVGSTCHYDGLVCTDSKWVLPVAGSTTRLELVDTACSCTWPARSLVSEKFFNFSDLKPGDWGENTVDLYATNETWMCGNFAITANSDLGKYLNVFWWVDDGDNDYEAGEKVLYGGPRTIDGWLGLAQIQPGRNGALPFTLADSYLNWRNWPEISPSPNAVAFPKNTSQYLGIGWCFGDLIVDEVDGGFTCTGSGNQQDAQGDSLIGDLTFTVEQSRNNPNFLCPEHANFVRP